MLFGTSKINKKDAPSVQEQALQDHELPRTG